MIKNPTVFLGHILECIELIDRYLDGVSEDEFLHSVEIQDMTLHRLMIIGEASNHIPKEMQEKYPDTQWRDVIGLRNIIIHEYFGTSLQEVWDTAQKDLPVLKKQIQGILSDIGKEPRDADL